MPVDPEIWWEVAARARSPEVWAGILAGMIYVYNKSPLATRPARLSEAAVSGLLAYSAGEWAAEWVGVAEPVAVILLSSVGYVALDVTRGLIADRKVIADIISRRLGGGNG
jgi:hypothetical protein